MYLSWLNRDDWRKRSIALPPTLHTLNDRSILPIKRDIPVEVSWKIRGNKKKRKEKLLHLSGRKFKSTVSGRDEFIRDIEDADFYAA